MPARRRYVLRLAAALSLVLSGARAAGQAGGSPLITTDRDRIRVDGEPMFLKGVDYSPFTAGDAPWTGVTKVNVRNDLLKIKNELHANAVRIYDPLPREFYEAARDFDLWVIQGIFLPNAPDLLAALGDMKNLVAAAHTLVHDRGGADRVLAYVLGSGFDRVAVHDTIRNRDHQADRRFEGKHYKVPPASSLPRIDRYQGTADCEFPEDFTTSFQFPDPHPFQSFLAQLAEHLAMLEEARGRRRPLVGHAITPYNNSFLGPRDRQAPGLFLPVDLSFLDVIFENIFTYDHPYVAYHGFADYIEKLKFAYPDNPVVILETGYSTSTAGLPPPKPLCGFVWSEPSRDAFSYGLVTEAEQALGIEARWVDTVTAERPLAGFFVYGYYDEWWLGGKPESLDTDQPIEVFQPLEHFGLMRVTGTAQAPVFAPKPAFFKLAELYGCEEPQDAPGACGLVIRSSRLIEATYGIPFDHALGPRGGAAPHRISIDPPEIIPRGVTGALPLGLSFDAVEGKIAGTPERMGEFRFRVTVEDSGNPRLKRERLTHLRVGAPRFSTRGKEILLNDQPFFLKGIDYSPFIAGDAPWTGVIKADPYADLKEIKEKLHANTIRTYQMLPRTVYDAARQNGLFVIQGVHLQLNCPDLPEKGCPGPGHELCKTEDPANLRRLDLFRPETFEELKEHTLREVEEIHKLDASDVMLCLVVGNEMNFCFQRATILLNQDRPRYKGAIWDAPQVPTPLPEIDRYEGCPPTTDGFLDPHPFQSFVAELVDVAAVLEADRYGASHLMAHATDPNMSIVPGARDRFFPDEHLPVDLSFLDIVFQNVYSYFPPAIRFLGYREYLEKAAAANSVPFVVLECGYSALPTHEQGFCAAGPICGQPTTPQPQSFCFGGNKEEEQAQGIAVQYARATGGAKPLVAGFFAFELYDEWWKGGERSLFVRDLDRAEEWFGIKSVSGTPDDTVIVPRPAFKTVGKMFDMSWCPEPGPLNCKLVQGQVEIKLPGPGPFDEIVLRRDGVEIARLAAGIESYIDRSPPAGERVYAAAAVSAFVECPASECKVEVPEPPGDHFRRGDVNADGKIDVTDPVRLLGYLFLGQTRPECLDAGDTDDNGQADISDAVSNLGYQFLGGGPPASPGPSDCGPDPKAEDPELGCDVDC